MWMSNKLELSVISAAIRKLTGKIKVQRIWLCCVDQNCWYFRCCSSHQQIVVYCQAAGKEEKWETIKCCHSLFSNVPSNVAFFF